jgi:glycosyltransferase involved in cell wall biosynthesis
MSSGSSTSLEQRIAPARLEKGASADLKQSIAVVIAAYNEGEALEPVVRGALAYAKWVVVVDDGSLDDTANKAHQAGAYVARHSINLGQGAALQTGIEIALRLGAAYVVTFDADGQHAAEEIEPIVRHLVATGSDVVLGSRFLGRVVNMPRSKAITLWLAVRFTRLGTGLKLTDTHNGFRALSRSAAQKLRIRQNRMAHASEILDQIANLKLRYCEYPVTITYTAYSVAKGQRVLNSVAIVKDQVMGRLAK